jgi:hypothetical protein
MHTVQHSPAGLDRANLLEMIHMIHNPLHSSPSTHPPNSRTQVRYLGNQATTTATAVIAADSPIVRPTDGEFVPGGQVAFPGAWWPEADLSER